ncbi:MAG: hypothetical protein JXQ97_14570 [Natronospirillum sp.]
MNALEQRWQQVTQTSQAIRRQLEAGAQNTDEAERLLQDRDALLRDLLSESFLSLLGPEELSWLQAQVESFMREDTRLRDALSTEQQRIQNQLKQDNNKAKAAKAYQQGRS